MPNNRVVQFFRYPDALKACYRCGKPFEKGERIVTRKPHAKRKRFCLKCALELGLI
jgi:hypothetical protein